MTFTIGVHFDNADQLTDPHLAFWFPGGGDPTVVAAMGSDGFGSVYQLTVSRRRFQFMFKEGPGLSGRCYEMSVYGFTEGDPDIAPENRGTFRGVTERIDHGYFDRLGVTALSLMPLAEFSSTQSPSTLGYNSSVFRQSNGILERPTTYELWSTRRTETIWR
jgi:hypothetical protein